VNDNQRSGAVEGNRMVIRTTSFQGDASDASACMVVMCAACVKPDMEQRRCGGRNRSDA